MRTKFLAAIGLVWVGSAAATGCSQGDDTVTPTASTSGTGGATSSSSSTTTTTSVSSTGGTGPGGTGGAGVAGGPAGGAGGTGTAGQGGEPGGQGGTGGSSADNDADGVTVAAGDCDDTDPQVFPLHPETCDGKDNDCDGTVDQGATTTFFRDADGDGIGVDAAATNLAACALPPGYAALAGDCNDADSSVSPNEPEACDGKDNDCDGSLDEGVTTTFFRDGDGDGIGLDAQATNVAACALPPGFAAQAGDCDDTDSNAFPGNPEQCDDKDNDCDGAIDQGLLFVVYRDADGDNFGVDDAATNLDVCDIPQGYVATAGDCNDADAAMFPANPEVCDGKDNDCAGGIDNGVPLTTYYRDLDADGYGNSGLTQLSCSPPVGSWATVGGDCDDADPQRYPGNPELCDGKDNDCNAATPEPGLITYYRDADSDTYGSPLVTLQACQHPSGYVLNAFDCNDADPNINPGALEQCDNIDNNCVNGVDEGPTQVWPDGDGDGFGDVNGVSSFRCAVKPGTAANNSDCADSNAGINPSANEIPGNLIDENCDGVDTAAGTLCGVDSAAAASLPYTYQNNLGFPDQSTGGPAGANHFWDDFEISSTANQKFTALYAALSPATMQPRLYLYGPNNCSTPIASVSPIAQGSPKGNYLAFQAVANPVAGYYYSPVTTNLVNQTGSYVYDVVPGNLAGSCGNDTTITWPLGWRKAGSLTTTDAEPAPTPVATHHYANDFEFYLQSGHTYSLLMGGTNFSPQMYLTRAGACGTVLGSANAGIQNGGAKLLFTPSQSDIYAAYLSSTAVNATGSYTFNVVEGDIGNQCFTGSGPLGGTGDSFVLYPLGGAVGIESLAIGDRAGDFLSRFFDDFETYLEAGDQVTITMTRTSGSYRPRISLSKSSACATIVTEVFAPAGSNTTTLTYTAIASGAYTILFSSFEANAAGNYTYTTAVN